MSVGASGTSNRIGWTTHRDVAWASSRPAASSIRASESPWRLPAWITVPVATRRSLAGEAGARKLIDRSDDSSAVLGGSVVKTAPARCRVRDERERPAREEPGGRPPPRARRDRPRRRAVDRRLDRESGQVRERRRGELAVGEPSQLLEARQREQARVLEVGERSTDRLVGDHAARIAGRPVRPAGASDHAGSVAGRCRSATGSLPLGDLIADPRLRPRLRQPRVSARRRRHDPQAPRRQAMDRLPAPFRGWHRHPLLQPGRFTELFFLDDATAMAAGHRACALCRRADYERLTAIWRTLHPDQVGADAIDRQLHRERIGEGPSKRSLHAEHAADLPDGTFVLRDGDPTWSSVLASCDGRRPGTQRGCGAEPGTSTCSHRPRSSTCCAQAGTRSSRSYIPRRSAERPRRWFSAVNASQSRSERR